MLYFFTQDLTRSPGFLLKHPLSLKTQWKRLPCLRWGSEDGNTHLMFHIEGRFCGAIFQPRAAVKGTFCFNCEFGNEPWSLSKKGGSHFLSFVVTTLWKPVVEAKLTDRRLKKDAQKVAGGRTTMPWQKHGAAFWWCRNGWMLSNRKFLCWKSYLSYLAVESKRFEVFERFSICSQWSVIGRSF